MDEFLSFVALNPGSIGPALQPDQLDLIFLLGPHLLP